MNNIIFIIFLLIILTGSFVVLQVFLAKKQNKWFGLILPLLSLFISIIIAFAYGMLAVLNSSVIIAVIVIFLFFNIPTVILLAVYFVCRGKLKSDIALDKMKIKDL